MAKTDAINTANPAGSSDPKLGDDYIRQLARAVVEVLKVDHYLDAASPYDEDAAGEHAKVTFNAPITKPDTVAANKGILYIKDVGGVSELCFINENEQDKQLTTLGALNIAATEAALLTGDQTIAGVKTFSSSPVVPAPTTDLQASTKKYVDDVKIVPAKITNVFSAWETKTFGQTYEALTDGIVCCHITATNTAYVRGLTDENETPTTVRVRAWNTYGYSSPNTLKSGLTMPVKKGDHWKVENDGGSTPSSSAVYWLPIGV